MRNRFSTVLTVLNTLGSLIMIQGVLLLIPIIFCIGFGEFDYILIFFIPSIICLFLGFLFTKIFTRGKIFFLQSLLICGLAWIVLSFFAALPFFLSHSCSYLDAYFETVSGYTTTGITIFTEIEKLPGCILFWRSLIQWTGGLGILTLFLAVTFKSNNAYFQLFSAESHKIDSARPTPSIKKTIISLWLIYIVLTSSEMIILFFLGLSPFDALCHSLTTLSTGGFSTYDSSIDHFRQAAYVNYQAIEYVITFFMFLGGVNFLLHYLIRFGRIREVLTNLEFKYYICLIFLFTGLIVLNHYQTSNLEHGPPEEIFRTSLFTTVSLITTTGFGTTDINAAFFPAMSRQLLLILMFIGGSVGSTAGGVKVLRVAVLFKVFRLQIKRLWLPRKAITELVIDGNIFPEFEIKRISGLVIGWAVLIFLGGVITAFFTHLDPFASFSGMFSALGNIGPCFFSVQEMSELPALVKVTYIFGMLAGRLEILPILLIFNRKAWSS